MKRLLSFVLAAALAVLSALPVLPAKAAGGSADAVPTRSPVLVNGKPQVFDAYTINDSNYFKLRDLASAVSGTARQFGVSWDGSSRTVTLESGKPYTPIGGEMTVPTDPGAKEAVPAAFQINADGQALGADAYLIGGNTYFKLRDIGRQLDIGVFWDGASHAVLLDTSVGYTEGEPAYAIGAGYLPDTLDAALNQPITRAQFCSLLIRLLAAENISPLPKSGFADTDSPDVLKAYALGLVDMSADGYFKPDDALTNEQMADMLDRAVRSVSGSAGTAAGTCPYTDAGQISASVLPAVCRLYGMGILDRSGDGLFRPSSSVTLESAAVLVWRAYRQYTPSSNGLTVAGKSLWMGMSVSELVAVFGQPQRVDRVTADGSSRYVYNADPANFFIATVCSGGTVTAVYTDAKGFVCNGKSFGCLVASAGSWLDVGAAGSGTAVKWFTDKYNGGKLYAVAMKADCPQPDASDGLDYPGAAAEWAQDMLDITNALRACYGVSPLAWNKTAAAAAQSFSLYLFENRTVGHCDGQGRGLSGRLAAAGAAYTEAGENAAYINFAGPGSLFDSWVNSEVHRNNLLNPDWTSLGVGYTLGDYAAAGYIVNGVCTGAAMYQFCVQDFIRT